MAIDYHDLTALADTLKYVYGTGITNQFNDEKVTYNQFPKSERKPKGLGYEFSIRLARAQGVGARAESAKLPDPLVGKFDKGRINPKYIYGSIRLTGPSIEAAKGDVAAFVDGLSDSIDDIYQSVIVDLNRQSWGDSFGKLAKLSAANASLDNTTTETVTCDNATGVQYLHPGMLIDIYNTAGSKPEGVPTTKSKMLSALRILRVDPFTKKVYIAGEAASGQHNYRNNHPRTSISTTKTLASAQSAAASALIVKMGAREKSHATTDTPVEMMGLLGIYDDGTLLATFENITVSSAAVPEWEANILGNSSVDRELSIDLMLQGMDLTRMESGKVPNIMRMGLGQRRKYANLLLPDVRFQPTVLKGGYETLTFAGGDGTVEILIDPVAQPGKIFMEPRGTIQKYEMSPLGWGNLDQQIHQRAGYDEWDMFLRIYTQLGCEQRNCLTLIKDLVEPSLYS